MFRLKENYMRKLRTAFVAVSLLSAPAIFAAPRKVTKDAKEVQKEKENAAAAKTAKDQKQKQQTNKQQTSKQQTKK